MFYKLVWDVWENACGESIFRLPVGHPSWTGLKVEAWQSVIHFSRFGVRHTANNELQGDLSPSLCPVLVINRSSSGSNIPAPQKNSTSPVTHTLWRLYRRPIAIWEVSHFSPSVRPSHCCSSARMSGCWRTKPSGWRWMVFSGMLPLSCVGETSCSFKHPRKPDTPDTHNCQGFWWGHQTVPDIT